MGRVRCCHRVRRRIRLLDYGVSMLKAGQLINRLHNIGDSQCESLANLVRESVKFRARTEDFFNIKGSFDFESFNIPFDVMYIEFSEDCDLYGFPAFLLLKEGQSIYMFGFDFSIKDNKFIPYPKFFQLKKDSFVRKWMHCARRDIEIGDELDNSMIGGAACCSLFIQAMNCSNVSSEEINIKESTNRKREKKGKKIFYSYKTLVINQEKTNSRTQSNGGTHASPRLHLRRGHVRTLKDGRKIWVQSCVVGDKESGSVGKDYSVVI